MEIYGDKKPHLQQAYYINMLKFFLKFGDIYFYKTFLIIFTSIF